MAVVVRNVPRADLETVDAFASLGVATVHEAQGRTGLLEPYLRPRSAAQAISGSALTVSVPPADNWMIHVALDLARPGDVLVVSPTTRSDAGYVGELIAIALQARGVRGVVIDGGCRDTSALDAMGFPVWSRCVSALGTTKAALGDVNLPIVCAGQIVNPGDIVVADHDGVVVVSRLRAVEVLDAARQRAEAEIGLRTAYRDGETYLDRSDQRRRLTDAGLVYLDESPGSE